MKPENPFREGTLIWEVMEGDWEDLTVNQIAEVLDTTPQQISVYIAIIKRKIGYTIPRKKGSELVNRLFVVRIPDCSDLSVLAPFRDYVMDCLSRGVLVLEESSVCEVMELPELCGAAVTPFTGPEDEDGPTEAEEKRAILQRLQEFRDKNGVGCLTQVTRRMGRSALRAEVLRGVLTGDSVLEIRDWRRIGRALDRLDAQSKEASDV